MGLVEEVGIGVRAHHVCVLQGLKNEHSVKFGFKGGGVYMGKKQSNWLHRNAKNVGLALGSMIIIFLFDSFMVSVFNTMILENASLSTTLSAAGLKEDDDTGSSSSNYVVEEKQSVEMYSRLLNLASAALAEKDLKPESSSLWKEPNHQASQWRPCADRKLPIRPGRPNKSNGYILVSANGGLNQQRVAVCNAVAVASLLNATLVLPRFLYSNVWKDPSQFGDIYQEEYFIKLLKDEVEIVKDLPPHLRSLDLEAIGSQITDADIVKEAKPIDYIRIALPRLKRNGVVHFLGFGNRLGFDPLPFSLQRLRCKCNFHALKFVPKIQETASVLIQRIRRRYDTGSSMLDRQLLGNFNPILPHKEYLRETESSKYLALHLRFEEDMVAYSQCDFGGGDEERMELQAYRQVHFPLLMDRLKDSKTISPEDLRILGKCPLTPEEAALVLAGLGFKSTSYIFLAGSQIYGGKSRMQSLTRLYPKLVTKETLLTPTELSPFRNFSSQMAALDFIGCATADVFAMTDSGSQLSSLVSGYRTYYGEGGAPTLRPNKKRLAAILLESGTISWNSFEYRVKKMIDQGHKVHRRRYGRSIYRQPRSPECMCTSSSS